MQLLALRTNMLIDERLNLPLTVYTAGTEEQPPMLRMEGFSANQLLITHSGTGRFREYGQDKWDIVTPGQVLYLPAHRAHEYMPIDEFCDPWRVGFVSFRSAGPMNGLWGLDSRPMLIPVAHTGRLFDLLEQIWVGIGDGDGIWAASERLYSLLTEMRKQCSLFEEHAGRTVTGYGDSVVLKATKFLEDHMYRDLSIAGLSEQIGYSQKQLTRLFAQAYGTTPLQYLKRLRLMTAAHLLDEQAAWPISRIARHVGMEPVYFAREFRKRYGVVPTDYRNGERRAAVPSG
jgi:AraC-like DNA-binding protein